MKGSTSKLLKREIIILLCIVLVSIILYYIFSCCTYKVFLPDFLTWHLFLEFSSIVMSFSVLLLHIIHTRVQPVKVHNNSLHLFSRFTAGSVSYLFLEGDAGFFDGSITRQGNCILDPCPFDNEHRVVYCHSDTM